MTSEVAIGNIALDHLGEDTITALTDEVKAARLIKRRYPQVRDAVLAANLWNSAMARASLASTDPAPAWGPAASFALPADFLRLVEIQGATHAWRREGRRLVTNAPAPVNIRYLRRITDPNEFDPLLIEAIGARLAADLAIPIKDSTTVQRACWQLYLDKLKEARGVDAQEGTAEVVGGDDWLAGRAVGVGNPFGDSEEWA